MRDKFAICWLFGLLEISGATVISLASAAAEKVANNKTLVNTLRIFTLSDVKKHLAVMKHHRLNYMCTFGPAR